jgi:hypothetical protein
LEATAQDAATEAADVAAEAATDAAEAAEAAAETATEAATTAVEAAALTVDAVRQMITDAGLNMAQRAGVDALLQAAGDNPDLLQGVVDRLRELAGN